LLVYNKYVVKGNLSQPVRKETSPIKIWGLHTNIFFLGLVSLLTDVSSEMIFTLVPLFVLNVLGAGALAVGLIGGLSECTDAILRIFSGYISDRIKKRKFLAVLGYTVSTISKPLMYLASTWGAVLAVRFGDRFGKGIRTSPRDALVADFTMPRERGKGFGVHRAMDTTGAVLGLAIAAVIVYLMQGGSLDLSLETYRRMVLIGVVPAVLAVLILLAFVRDKGKISSGYQYGLLRDNPIIKFDARFKIFLVIMGIFTLGNSSDFFVILRAQNMGSPVLHIMLMLVLLNVSYAAISIPAGMLSDKLGRRRIIILGWAIYALVYLGFATASSPWQIWGLFIGYGIYYGVVEGVARAFVADLVPEVKMGTAYGFYHGVVGLTLLPASIIAGWLWDTVNPAAPFYFGAVLAFLAMLGLSVLIRE
jgi:MFS family permease